MVELKLILICLAGIGAIIELHVHFRSCEKRGGLTIAERVDNFFNRLK